MKKISSWVPDEWLHAWWSAVGLIQHASATSAFAFKQLIAFLIPFSVGAVFAHQAVVDIPASGASDLMRGILTFVAIVTGFMITLLLFTGKGDQTAGLSSEEMEEYSDLVKYLIFAQVLTLFLHLLSALLVLCWFAASASGHSNWFLTVSSFGCVAVSISRTLLLPLQIFDLHDFALKSMVKAKRKDEREQAQRLLEKIVASTDVTRL